MKIILLVPFLLVWGCTTKAQKIHALEPVSGHYKAFQSLSPDPNPDRSHLDQITYPTAGRATGKQFIGIAPTYLNTTDVEALKKVLAFPSNSSDQAKAELEYLLEWQEKRSKAEQQRAWEIARIGYWPPLQRDRTSYGNVEHLFWECESVVGSSCTPANYPLTMHLLAGVTRDMRIMEFTIKYHLLRPRPYHLEPKLDPMGRVSNPSFASGHTLWAYIQAFTWSELIPEKRKEFLALAFEIGESREIMGIHYPSDEEAARVMAHQMLVRMLKNDEFLSDLANAKEEWK